MSDPNQSAVDPIANTTGAGFQQAPVSHNPANGYDDAQKVFAGNLAFATTEDELRNVFSEAGTVTEAQIITRGTRSLGYGFVTFSTEAEAQKAIQTLNKREISGREISVESAKPPKPRAEGVENEKKPSTRVRAKPKPKNGAAPRRARADEGEDDTADAEVAASTEDTGAKAASKSAKRRAKKEKAANATEPPKPEQTAEAPRKPKAKREPKGPPKGEPSKTLVFVANLAFTTTSEQLKHAFGEYNVKSAHVVQRGRSGKYSKGFGFVEFHSEADQLRALANAQGKHIDGRDISLKVAIQHENPADLSDPTSP